MKRVATHTSWCKSEYVIQPSGGKDHDRIFVDRITINNYDYILICVCDGHGSSKISDFVCDNILSVLQKQLVANNSVTKAIKNTFVELNDQSPYIASGTTLTMLLIRYGNKDKTDEKCPNIRQSERLKIKRQKTGQKSEHTNKVDMWVANVGDSDVYMFDKNSLQKLSMSHDLSNSHERKRIMKCNPITIQDATFEYTFGEKVKSVTPHKGVYSYLKVKRVGTIMMTRCIGDKDLGPAVSPYPYVKKVENVKPTFVLATDGLWDVLTPTDVSKIIFDDDEQSNNDGEQANDVPTNNVCERIMNQRNMAFRNHDDTSVIVVTLDLAKF